MTVLFKPILALHINFSSCQNYWGGGAKRYVCPPPPNIFIGGRLPPPPPRIDASGTVAGPGFAKNGGALRAPRARACLIRVGSLPGAQGAEPPEALEFSANKGLQDGRQE